ncbi:MAG TPA: hypothetical protein ENL10_00330 [Candidatus Cloacimonetes bacterium]|nr:hypothetical protein [Candidatus Cloacimonadota bacterium]HHE39933.1 hypothetical protein [Candidatus Cloacimonadota bacterium]
MKKTLKIIAVVMMILLVVSCTAGVNQMENKPDKDHKVAGFWRGLWNGFIILFSFIISLFNDNVTIYEVHNNGALYNLGFLLGIMLFFGGSGGGAASRKRR